MIKLGDGRISTIVVSTILGHGGDGLGMYNLLPQYRSFVNYVLETETTVIAKSATRHKRTGNYVDWKPWTWKYVKRVKGYNGKDGILNAYGLTNDGVRECAKKISKAIKKGFVVIPSFFPEFINGEKRALIETEEAIEIYGEELGSDFIGFEYNSSCPNSGEDFHNYRQILTCTQMIDETLPEDVARIVKFSPIHSHDLVIETQELYGIIAHWANTFPAKNFYPHRQSPLHKVGGGGYSGPMIFSTAYEGAFGLSRKINGRIIFGGGVSNADDAQSYIRLMRNKRDVSVSICSIVALDPREAKNIIKRNVLEVKNERN
jgi:dihydroorotate dehydrogenase